MKIRVTSEVAVMTDSEMYIGERRPNGGMWKTCPSYTGLLPMRTNGSTLDILVTVGLDMAKRRYNSKAW